MGFTLLIYECIFWYTFPRLETTIMPWVETPDVICCDEKKKICFLQASAVLWGAFSGGDYTDMDEVTAWLFSQDKRLFVHIIFSSVQLFTQLLHSLCVK